MQRNTDRFDISNSEIDYLIDQWIRNERDRAILKDRLINGMTFERLAEKHGMSVRQIQNIVYKSMDRLVSKI